MHRHNLRISISSGKLKETSKHVAHCCLNFTGSKHDSKPLPGSNKQIPSENSWNPTMSREVCGVRSFHETKAILQLVDPGHFALGASPPISQLPTFAFFSIMESYVYEGRLISRDWREPIQGCHYPTARARI